MQSFQDLLGSENHCHGCGPNNQQGLRIKSFWDGDVAVCRYRPLAHQCAGATTIVNGGIIASLIDCHCVGAAMADAYRRANREIGSEPKLWYVTGKLEVSYLKPTPIDQELLLSAKITSVEGRKTKITCELSAKGEVCARGEVLAVAIARV